MLANVNSPSFILRPTSHSTRMNMADGVFISERLSAKCVFEQDVSRTVTKAKRNRNRYFRRKRSRRNYRKTVRESRIRKRSENLCAEVSVYDFTGMSDGTECFPQLPKEVSDWQYYHQLAYWKSRAISLEFENRMLHAHLERICAKEIQDYVEYVRGGVESGRDEGNSNDVGGTKSSQSDVEELRVEAGNLNLYGEEESKIKAMETAMDVNFKMQVSNKKPVMWPNIPLNL